ncbi:hypothetical protein SAMN04487764_2286 [Gillisia sp. Hel1_33_143]|uniref:hypothetical protein n=1 Tax=unclassified Gillisia TaxID=2615025 RepID=UPI0005554069|nr:MULTISPECIES: hypothetical protein [unclassified Gillisia]SDS46779.1 hypothetical protein SAMN04487764_2286 [Gillisia sp. Hel1_33_143]
MDELEFLKKDWKKQDGNYPKLSYDQLYKMIWKKSSSIVRWIFIISVLEFVFWGILNFCLADQDFWKEMDKIHLKWFTIGLYLIGYVITFYFIFKFYKNYKKITATDSAAILMENIINTRKTVKYYIGYILISTGFTFLVYTYFTLKYHTANLEIKNPSLYDFDTSQWLLLIVGFVVFMLVFLGLIWLFYKLLYGILLNRLQKNYKELKRLEIEN